MIEWWGFLILAYFLLWAWLTAWLSDNAPKEGDIHIVPKDHVGVAIKNGAPLKVVLGPGEYVIGTEYDIIVNVSLRRYGARA